MKENNSQNILVALAWPYANGSLHLGHIAAFIGSDVLARYHRLCGDAVLFVSGSDCYGTPIAIEAAVEGISPASIAERYHKEFKKTLIDELGFTYDLYSTTMTPEHAESVQSVFSSLYEKGYIYTKTAQALYSPFLERFLPDRFVEGECPHCSYDGARGDQCDSCGSLLDPLLLRSPRINRKILGEDVSINDTALEVRDSEQFYLKLTAFQSMLEEWTDRVSPKWRVNAEQITKSFLKLKLEDRAITRDIDWGIPVPIPGYESKKVYVWFEAVLGYLSASQHYSKLQGTPSSWHAWWKNDSAIHYYVHGKDNVQFHAIILPAILLGVGGLHLPDRVFSSEYLSLEGKQFSTSRSYAVWASDFLASFDGESLRYFLLAQGPETGDVDFRWSEFGQLVNGELIGTFGNLINRICTLAQQHFPDGVSPPTKFSPDAQKLLDFVADSFVTVGDAIQAGKFRHAFRIILQVAEQGNRFAHTTAPWKTLTESPDKAEADVAALLHTIYSLSLLVQPFLPRTSEKIQSFFDFELFTSDTHSQHVGKAIWHPIELKSCYLVRNVSPIFKKIEDKDLQNQREKLGLL